MITQSGIFYDIIFKDIRIILMGFELLDEEFKGFELLDEEFKGFELLDESLDEEFG